MNVQHGVPRVAVGEKTEASRRKELKQIEAYQGLVDNVQAKVIILSLIISHVTNI